MKYILAFVACLGLATGLAYADAAPLAPSAVIAAASTYDNQDVTVTGTVKDVQQQQTRRGQMTRYQLCDSQCVNVVDFGATPPTDGQTQTVTGHFRAAISRGHMQATNVILVGMKRGWKH